MTCSRHVCTNSECTNFVHESFSYYLLKQGKIHLLRSKNVSITIYFHKKRHFAATSKENKNFFAKKIRRFGIRENT